MFYIISHLGLRYLECYQLTVVVKPSLSFCYTYAEKKGLFRNNSTCIHVFKIISSLYHMETRAEPGSRAV